MRIVEMLLKNQLLGMFWLIFVHIFLITAESSKDFLVTKFDKERILRLNEDYVAAQTYLFFPESEIESFQAKCQKDKLMLIWVDKTEFVMRYIDSKSFMTPPDDLKFNSDTIFDVQANGDLLVMTTTNETHTTFSLGNFATSEVETVLSVEGFHLRNVAIHPTKRVIYYTTCFGATFFLNVYDVDAKQNIQRFAPPHCLDGILFDDRNDILWAFDGDQLFKGNLKKKSFEEVYQRDRGIISSLALGSKDLLILHYKEGTQVYNFTLNPTPIKELTLPPFRITPIIGYFTVLFSPKLFLLDVDNKQLILYDKDFKQIWKNAVRIENKDVSSVDVISRTDGSMEFYWIHPSNAGKMEVVLVSSAGTVTDQKTIRLGNEDITDFSINKKSFTFYLAINNGIYLSNPDLSQAQLQATTLFYDMEKPVKAVLVKMFSLVVTFCDGVTKRFSHLLISKPRPTPQYETVECFHDVQVISNDPYFVSSTGIYTAAPRMQNFEKLYDIQGLKNILTYDGHVYFVASLADTGPGIYKLPKSRSGQAYYSPGYSPTNFVAAIKGDCRRMREFDDKWEVKSTATDTSSLLTTKGPSEPNDGDDNAISSATTASSDKTSDKRLSDNNSASKVVWNIYEIYVLATLVFLLLSF